MQRGRRDTRSVRFLLTTVFGAGLTLAAASLAAQQPQTFNGQPLHLYDAADFGINPQSVTFSRDIAPILQQSCQNCHRPGGAAPMSFITYDEVRPWATAIKLRTAIRDRMGAMPPWYAEKDIGIQHYKQDPSLSDEQLALIQAWADNGAPQGNPADMPVALDFSDGDEWRIKPDFVVSSSPITVGSNDPDWWGEIESIPLPIEEDRYVKSVEVREVMDSQEGDSNRSTVGGRYIVHHMIWRTQIPGTRETTSWPVHEVGRNPDLFDDDAGRLLKAGSQIASESVHLHSNGRTTTSHLEIGFELFPKGYEPKYEGSITNLANGSDIDIRANQSNQQLRAFTVVQKPTKVISFEPHLHAPGERMCLEASFGFKTETLSCVGYDHNWVRTYVFEEDYQPLLPPGTILQITGYMNNSDSNPNVPDARNWQGSGNRSLANMFIDLGERVTMTEEQFAEEVRHRVEKFKLTKNDYMIGCPLCLAVVNTPGPKASDLEVSDSGTSPNSAVASSANDR